jgi:hypothetical protein
MFAFLGVCLVAFSWASADEAEPIELFRAEVIAALAKIEAAPRDAQEAEKQARAELVKIVDKYSAKLRPNEGSKKYVSQDKSLVLVIAANGQKGMGGGSAQVDDAEAKLVLAVGGNGSPAKDGQKATGGGAAIALARSGVAIAIAGNGGDGAAGLGGGGGGGASGIFGGSGGISLSGSGGVGPAGELGGLGAIKIDKPEAIAQAIQELQKIQKK